MKHIERYELSVYAIEWSTKLYEIHKMHTKILEVHVYLWRVYGLHGKEWRKKMSKILK